MEDDGDDFVESGYEIEGEDFDKYGFGVPFVVRLRKVMMTLSMQNVIHFMPDGHLIAIQKDLFVSEALNGNQFRTSKFSSFVRNLNKHGFKKTGPDGRHPQKSSYLINDRLEPHTSGNWVYFCHPYFHRDDPLFEDQAKIIIVQSSKAIPPQPVALDAYPFLASQTSSISSTVGLYEDVFKSRYPSQIARDNVVPGLEGKNVVHQFDSDFKSKRIRQAVCVLN